MNENKHSQSPDGADRPLEQSRHLRDNAATDGASDEDEGLCISQEYEDTLFNLPASDRVLLMESTNGVVPITGSVMGVNTKEAKRVQLLRDSARLVKRLGCAKYTVFKLTERKIHGRTHLAIQRTGLAGEVRQLFRDLNPQDIELYFPQHRLNPFVDLWFSHLRAQPRMQSVGKNWDDLLDDDARQVVDELNAFTKGIQDAVRSPGFRALFDRHRRRCDRNTKNVRDYIHAIFKHKGRRQLVMRLDLGYSKAVSPLGMLTPTSVSLEQVREDLAKLVRHVRDHFPLTGYAWKLEFGAEKGCHVHLLIFMNGRAVREDMTIARRMGEYWQAVVTGGQGRYFNCNATTYRNRGIGMVHHDDGEKMAALMEVVAPYLTKVDFWMYYDPLGHTFGKGQMPKEESKAGRARKAA